jgi:type VI secretion system protein ImpM
MDKRVGYFGKVTTHGDFVSRRLPVDVAQAWDDWLQRCIHASRQQLGGEWLSHYLTSPVWRFAIAPGVLGQDGWGGVMMPSVDRVGRHFPLMLAAPGNGALLERVHQQVGWYDALDDLARCSLDPSFTLEQFDAAPLPPESGPAPAPVSGQRWCMPLAGDMTAQVAEVLLQGRSLWWTEGSPSVASSLLVSHGMPDAEAFAAMLDGSWAARGWTLPA